MQQCPYGYRTDGQRTQTVDPEGRATVTGYDRAGRTTSVTQPSYTAPGPSTAITPQRTVSYDAAGRPVVVTDARGYGRFITYDQLDRAVRVINPPAVFGATSGTATAEYDMVGEVTATVDPTGARVQATYDDLGRQVTQTALERRPASAAFTTKTAYDPAGRPTTVTRPAGDLTQLTYNTVGELATSLDALGQQTGYAYDLAGRLQKVTNPQGRAVQADYDLAGRNTAVKDLNASGTVLRTRLLGYDAEGNPVSSTSGQGYQTVRRYDNGNRLTSVTEPVTDTHSITTSLGYDANGALTQQTDGRGNTTTTSYNTLGLVESVVEPATTAHPAAADRTWTTGYDAEGNAMTQDQPGGVQVATTYDALGRVTGQTGTLRETVTSQQPASSHIDDLEPQVLEEPGSRLVESPVFQRDGISIARGPLPRPRPSAPARHRVAAPFPRRPTAGHTGRDEPGPARFPHPPPHRP